MPEKKTIARAKRDQREVKAPSTPAGAFVREKIAGVALETPKTSATPRRTRKQAEPDLTKGRSAKKKSSSRRAAPSPTRARAAKRTSKGESSAAASPRALSRQSRTAASRRRKRGASARRVRARADA
jgi:hypothetical protein